MFNRLLTKGVLFSLFFLTCEKAELQVISDASKQSIVEMVDIRIFPDGTMLINGNQSNYSSLHGHIDAMNIGESTAARFIFVTGEQTPLVYETTRLLKVAGVKRIKKHILQPVEFREYLKNTVHIDIPGSGKILFQGNELYPQDLSVALKRQQKNKSRVIITLTDDFDPKVYRETLSILQDHSPDTIITRDLRDF